MGVWAVAGGRGAPGVSTTALALGLMWPDGRHVRVVEADPDGGTYAARAGMGSSPGLAEVVPALRRGAEPDWAGVAILHGGRVPVVCGPPTADESGALVRAVADSLVPSLVADRSTDSILDLGRLTPTHPLVGAIRHLDGVVVMAHPTLESFVALRPRIAGWPGGHALVVTLGPSDYGHQDLAEFLGVARVDRLPVDPTGVASLDRPARFVRSALARSAASMAAGLVAASLDRVLGVATSATVPGPLRLDPAEVDDLVVLP